MIDGGDLGQGARVQAQSLFLGQNLLFLPGKCLILKWPLPGNVLQDAGSDSRAQIAVGEHRGHVHNHYASPLFLFV